MAKKQTVNSITGNVKREYSKEDYNPFKAMDLIYNSYLSGGVGTVVLVVGYSERFSKESVRAWWHVMTSRGMLKGSDTVPIPDPSGDFLTHTGAILRFMNVPNEDAQVARLKNLLNQSTVIALCSRYTSPALKQVIRAESATKVVCDFSRNNEISVDKG